MLPLSLFKDNVKATPYDHFLNHFAHHFDIDSVHYFSHVIAAHIYIFWCYFSLQHLQAVISRIAKKEKQRF